MGKLNLWPPPWKAELAINKTSGYLIFWTPPNTITFVTRVAQTHNKNIWKSRAGQCRTPCQELANQLNDVTIPECIKTKWRLTIYKSGTDTTSGTYSLEGFKFRGDNILKGTWQIIKGTKADPNAIVYQLRHSSKGSLFFLKQTRMSFSF